MNRLIRFELFKLFKKNSFKVLLILIIISCFLTCYTSNKKVNYEYDNYPSVSIDGLNKNSTKLVKRYNMYVEKLNEINNISKNIKVNKIMDNGTTLLIFNSIIIIILSSSILGNEINKKSIKELLTKPYKRSKILISKYLTMYLVILLLTLFIFIMYTLFCCILTKSNIFILKDYFIFKNHIEKIPFILKHLCKFIISSIPMYFLATFTIFLTTFIKNQKIIIPLNSVLFIMSPAILNFFLGIKFKYIIYTFIPYLDFSIFKDIYSILMLNIEYNMNFNIVLGGFVLFIYGILFLILSVHIFNKRNFW